jgi:hypothetical protein
VEVEAADRDASIPGGLAGECAAHGRSSYTADLSLRPAAAIASSLVDGCVGSPEDDSGLSQT